MLSSDWVIECTHASGVAPLPLHMQSCLGHSPSLQAAQPCQVARSHSRQLDLCSSNEFHATMLQTGLHRQGDQAFGGTPCGGVTQEAALAAGGMLPGVIANAALAAVVCAPTPATVQKRSEHWDAGNWDTNVNFKDAFQVNVP